MRVIFWLVFLSACAGASALAQDVRLKVVPYRTLGYTPQQMGYPSKIVQGPNGTYYYVEYWKPGEGRREENRYIQAMQPAMESGNEFMNELWFRPITEPGKPQMEFRDIFGLLNNVLVVGRAPDPQRRNAQQVVVTMVGRGGQYVGPVARAISPFQQDMKEVVDEYLTSAKGEYFAWWGRNGELNDRGTKHYLTVIADAEGRKVYGIEIQIPESISQGKYVIQQVALDRRGNAFFLLKSPSYSGTAQDSLLRPKIVRYSHLERKYEDYGLELKGWAAPTMMMAILEDDHLYAFAAQSTGDTLGIRNSESADGANARIWNTLEVRRFSLQQNMALVNQTSTPIPDSLITRYRKAGGSFFTNQRIHKHLGQVYWLLEEQTTERKPQGQLFAHNDLLIFAFDAGAASLKWSSVVFKRQRDYGSNLLLGYVPGFTDIFVHIAFLTAKGAPGKVLMQSINRETGDFIVRELASNEDGRMLFFPARSQQVGNRLMLLGVGIPNEPNYALLLIKPLP